MSEVENIRERYRRRKRLSSRLYSYFNKGTLAPPIARKLAPIRWLPYYLLEKIPFLPAHYLVVDK